LKYVKFPGLACTESSAIVLTAVGYEMGRECSTLGEKRNACRGFGGKARKKKETTMKT
jgi:hypothetical protein